MPPGSYNLLVYGPNGFGRQFKGRIDRDRKLGVTHPNIQLGYDTKTAGIHLALRNNAREAVEFTVTDNAYGAKPQTISVASDETAKLFWPVKESGNWYDFSVTGPDGFLRKFAGRMEDEKDRITDPKMGRPTAPYDEPVLEAQV
jgi:phospholipase C